MLNGELGWEDSSGQTISNLGVRCDCYGRTTRPRGKPGRKFLAGLTQEQRDYVLERHRRQEFAEYGEGGRHGKGKGGGKGGNPTPQAKPKAPSRWDTFHAALNNGGGGNAGGGGNGGGGSGGGGGSSSSSRIWNV